MSTTDWSAVYRSVFPDLVRFLHRKVWDAERARDLAQEVFVRALREEPEKPRPFLFAVAANLARDEARMVVRRKRHLALLKSDVEGRRSRLGDPDRDMAEQERQDAVRAALESLGERDREVLLLWDAGLGYPEIAERTGLAKGAVGTTLARARKRLLAAHQARTGDRAREGRG